MLGHVAQGIEHQIPVLRVAGSIPAMLVKEVYLIILRDFFREFRYDIVKCSNPPRVWEGSVLER
jgi:hypothetical protein